MHLYISIYIYIVICVYVLTHTLNSVVFGDRYSLANSYQVPHFPSFCIAMLADSLTWLKNGDDDKELSPDTAFQSLRQQ